MQAFRAETRSGGLGPGPGDQGDLRLGLCKREGGSPDPGRRLARDPGLKGASTIARGGWQSNSVRAMFSPHLVVAGLLRKVYSIYLLNGL
jgi:hypothetical protein